MYARENCREKRNLKKKWRFLGEKKKNKREKW